MYDYGLSANIGILPVLRWNIPNRRRIITYVFKS